MRAFADELRSRWIGMMRELRFMRRLGLRAAALSIPYFAVKREARGLAKRTA